MSPAFSSSGKVHLDICELNKNWICTLNTSEFSLRILAGILSTGEAFFELSCII